MNFSQQLLQAMKETLPSHISPLSYMLDKLDISRESAYRRLRGEIDLTLEESITLCADLGISMDNLLMKKDENSALVNLHLDWHLDHSASEIYAEMLKSSIQMFQTFLESDPKFQTTITLNKIPFQWLSFQTLFKLHYFQYLHFRNETPYDFSFEEFEIPANILELQQSADQYRKKYPT